MVQGTWGGLHHLPWIGHAGGISPARPPAFPPSAQALLNLSSWEPPGSLAHYDAPTYLTAANLPASHMARVQLLEMPALPASTVKLLTLAHSSAKQGSGGGAAIASSGGSGGSGAAAEVAAAAAGARIAAVQRTSQTPDTMQPGSR